MKNDIPESVKNIVFTRRVCIIGKAFKEKLYVDTNKFSYNDIARRALTWMVKKNKKCKNTRIRAVWLLEPSNGNFYINNYYYKEYLFAARTLFITEQKRNVFTWIPGVKDVNGQDRWKLEPKGNDCLIKSIYFDEYMYPLNTSFYDLQRRQVATWVPKTWDHQCLWQFTHCY